tara:strand:+ start:158 stop:409 length:252 start_codon:yes stop_codon:yes gene_type:complete
MVIRIIVTRTLILNEGTPTAGLPPKPPLNKGVFGFSGGGSVISVNIFLNFYLKSTFFVGGETLYREKSTKWILKNFKIIIFGI